LLYSNKEIYDQVSKLKKRRDGDRGEKGKGFSEDDCGTPLREMVLDLFDRKVLWS